MASDNFGTENVAARICHLFDSHFSPDWLTLYQDGGAEPIEHSYQDFVRHSLLWSRTFIDHGLKPGGRILLSMPLCLDLLAGHAGALLAGLVPAIFSHPSQKHSEANFLASILLAAETSGRVAIVTAPDIKVALGSRLHSGDILLLDPGARASEALGWQAVALNTEPEAVAVHQYSSGTTGAKKGLPLTHRQLLDFTRVYAGSVALDIARDRIVSWLPLYHDMGFIACYMMPLLSGCPVVVQSPLDWVKNPQILFEAIERHRGTLCWLPNFAFAFVARGLARLASRDLSSLRGIINSSELVRTESVRRFYDRFVDHGVRADALAACYGLAECTYAATQTKLGAGLRQIVVDGEELRLNRRILRRVADHPAGISFVSSGMPLPTVDVRIDAPGGDDVGEILLRGPHVFLHYDGRSAAQSNIDADGYYHTGDVGFLYEGELFAVGRQDDIIIYAGKNIFPEDIEYTAAEVAGVVPGRVVAFGRLNEGSGTQTIVVLAETRENDPAMLVSIHQNLQQKLLEAIDAPVGVIHLLSHMKLLKSTSGKISRRRNRTAFEEGGLCPLELTAAGHAGEAVSADEADGEVEPMSKYQQRVVRCVENVLRTKFGDLVARVGPDTSIIRSGFIDSLSIAILCLELETEFAIPVEADQLGDIEVFDTVRSIETWLIARSGAAQSPAVGQVKATAASRNFLPPAVSEIGEDAACSKEEAARHLPWLVDLYALNALPGAPRDHIAGMGYVNPPFFSSTTLSTDNHGFRTTLVGGEQVLLEAFKALPLWKGLILGASASFGTGTSDRYTFPNVMNSRASATRRVWFNGSLRSANLKSEHSVLRHYGRTGFDGVLLFSGTNDYQYFTDSLNAREKDMGEPLDGAEIATLYDEFLTKLRPDFAEVVGLGRQLGLPMWFVLQPILPFTDKRFGLADALHFGRMRTFMGARVWANNFSASRYMWGLRDRFQEDIEKICAEMDVPFFNPSKLPEFQDEDPIFVDYWHYNETGHRVLADRVIERFGLRET